MSRGGSTTAKKNKKGSRAGTIDNPSNLSMVLVMSNLMQKRKNGKVAKRGNSSNPTAHSRPMGQTQHGNFSQQNTKMQNEFYF